ncbi:unnamed protein product, partial [Vitis vinifera]
MDLPSRSWSIHTRPEIIQKYEILERVGAGAYSDVYKGRRLSDDLIRWMVQILHAVDACHRNSIVHRDLKPSNLLISETGVLKLADFGQARILIEPGFDNPHLHEPHDPNQVTIIQHAEVIPEADNSHQEDDIDKETNFHDGNASCLATCTTSDIEEDDPFKGSYYYEAEEGGDDTSGKLTSCVGTRWFKAPELLYGSTNYGPEIDLWSLGCIFAELFSLEPLFPGSSDIDQLSRIFSVLGNLTEENSPGCSKYPDYGIISFNKVENPVGLEACLPNHSPDELLLVKKLICFDPASRATAMELLHDKYLNEEPLPVPVSELRVPSTNHAQDEGSPGECCDYKDMDSDSDFEEFSTFNVTTTNAGFSIQYHFMQNVHILHFFLKTKILHVSTTWLVFSIFRFDLLYC